MRLLFAPLPAFVLLTLAGCGGGGDSSSPSTPSSPPTGGTCAAGTPVSGTPSLARSVVASGLSSPVDLQSSAGDRTRLYVVEQAGRIRLVKNGALSGTPFLDMVARVGSGGERGLLGLAFHPQYAQNGRFFVNYTDRRGDTHVSEFRVSTNPDLADSGSEREVLFVAQPFSNHNGGALAFANDGTLFLALGDGGSGGDPFRNGQNLSTPLGKILRLDVDRGTPYAVPADNPFRSTAGALPEIWAYGLRNPWRISVDRATGDLYIGDVGQGSREEIDIGLASRRGGENYGWNVMEGTRCFSPSSGCSTAGLTLPVLDYGHNDGIAVTGGYVYRGCRMPGYQGTYFYGDYGTALIRSFRFSGGQATEPRDHTATLGRGLDAVSSFGVDADGEIYIVDYNRGEVSRIVPN